MKLIVLIVSLLFLPSLYAQEVSLDSLLKTYSEETDPKQQSVVGIEIAETYRYVNIDSAFFYAIAAYNLARSIDFQYGIAQSAERLGDYYVSENTLDSGYVYYTAASYAYQNIDSVFKYTQNTMRLANIQLAQNNHIDALKFYQECLDLAKESNYESLLPHLYNNMGLLYKQIEEYADAQSNFGKAYSLFIEQNDEANSVYPLYNSALVLSILGKDEEAINKYLSLTSYHLKTENWVSLASVYNSISEIYVKDEDYPRAKEYVEMALNAMEDKNDSFNSGPSSFYIASIYTNAADVYFNTNKLEKAKRYATLAVTVGLENSYKLNVFRSAKILGEIYDVENEVDSSLFYHKMFIDYSQQYQDEYDIKQLTKLKMQNEFDEILKQNEIERIYQEVAYKNRELKYTSITIVAVLAVIILVLLFFNQKNKNAKLKLKEENLLLEKRKLNQDLEYKKKELVSNLMYLLEKNEFITSISKKLIELKPDAKKDNKELIQQIINEIRQNSSNKIWDEFELRFKEVHTRFYNELYKAHPDLSPNEVKICAFLRLNMSTKEISAITHQSIKSINMARFRLRKKLQMERDENLISYLNSL